MKREFCSLFFAFQQNLIKCEVKIHLEFILVTKDIQEVSTFVSKKYLLSCLKSIHFHVSITGHESLNFLNIGQETLNYLANNNTIKRK